MAGPIRAHREDSRDHCLHGRKLERERGMRHAHHGKKRRRRWLGLMGKGAADLDDSGEFCGGSLCALSESGSERKSKMRAAGPGEARALAHPKERPRRGGRTWGSGK